MEGEPDKQNMDAVEVNTSDEPRLPPPNDDDVVGMVQEHQMDICRICLLGNSLMLGLFHGNSIVSLSEKVMSLTSVKMMPGDGLPSHICCDCNDKLELAYKFKLQVEQADSVLREKLDSLNIKEELFFSDVDVNLTSHRNDVGEITEESLLLKDHIDLLNVQKITDEESHLQNENIQKQVDSINIDQHDIDKHENEENHKRNEEISNIEIQEDQDMQTINNDRHIHLHEKDMQQIVNEEHNHSFGEQDLQEMMLDEISEHERIQQLNQTQHLTMHEHNYVVESQSCEISIENHTLNSVEIEQDTKENLQKESANEQIEIYDVAEESSLNESNRRSKRKINQQKSDFDRDSDEENYFENLNLSSRLKQVQSEKSEKVYFLCYLCDKQFLSKEVLKEHMHSHEEVRKTLSLVRKSPEKLQKTPEKVSSATVSPISSKPPSSGKQPNKCPHCGKEYLYIISFNKHLKQHEKEKNYIKDESMPLEVSFQENDDSLDYHNYDNSTIDTEEDYKQNENEVTSNTISKKSNLPKCNVCEEEFEAMDKLRDHRSKHVVEGVLTEQDLNNDTEQIEFTGICTKNDKDNININNQEESIESITKEELKDLKCPHCPMSYAHKKSLARHMESHCGTKYTCKICHQSFTRKDHLRRHAEQHGGRFKNFKCTQCNKTFGNELTLRNHLIATNHKTVIHGQEYDPNKRIKRVAAKAAQRIIDQLKTDFNLDEFDEEEKDKTKNSFDVKDEQNIPDQEQTDYVPTVPKKFQRNTKTLFCATCNQNCPSKQALTKHMAQHVKDETTSKQEKVKKSEENQENENEDNEEDDDDFEGGLDWPMDSHECPTCKKRYSTKKSLLRHQLLHEEPNFECDICNVKFYRKDKLKAHYDKCSEKNPDQVRKCNICGDSFENNEILKEHRAKHVTEGILTEEDLREIEPKPEDKSSEKVPRKRRTDIVGLECTECNKRYTSRKGLLRHIQVHEGKKYLCDICPKKFYRREHLKIHVAKHNMIKPYKCPRCTKRFIKEEQLSNHLTKHDKSCKKAKDSDTSKRFLCEICSKSFTQSTTLIAHLRAHNGIKPYVCEVCSRPFTTNAYLKMHMRTHTQERPYICQYCSRAFARADTLANHLTSHTGEAKYHCKYCPKNFRRLKSLKEHVFIHTGQRPYACPTCDRRFNNNGSRYAHSKRCKQNLLQGRQSQITVQNVNIEQQISEQHDLAQEEQEQLQLQEQQEIQNQLQPQRIHQATISQAQIIKPQNIKTITITRPDGGLSQQHVMTHQEILMPLILPLTVTLTDVGEEVILPEGTKIFSA